MIKDLYETLKKWKEYVIGGQRVIQTLLLGGFFISLQTIVTHIIVIGFLIRLIAGTSDEEFEFDDWKGILEYGIIGYAIWLVYFSLPMILWMLWIDYYYVATEELTSPTYAQRLANATTEVIGISFGMPWGAVYDPIRIIQDIGNHLGLFDLLNTTENPEIKSQILLSLFFATLFLALFLFPASVIQYLKTKRLKSSIDITKVLSLTMNGRYVITWSLIMTLWLLTFGIQHLWNDWDVSIPANDKYLVSIGFIPVMEAPTLTGVTTTIGLLLASFVSFILLTLSYYLLKEVIVAKIDKDQQ